MEILAIKDLSFCYAGEDSPALSDVNITVSQGDFTVLAGATGSGKSTLLRLIKRELAPRGVTAGGIDFCGAPVGALSDRDAAARIGYVAQSPEEQTVTDRVWHELAFGLECLGTPPALIRRRVAEVAAFFGIEDRFDRPTSALSGGEKQLLALASVMTMQPELLLLDEPTSRLDPIAARNFISAVRRLNRELGLTVIIAEHRLEDILPLATQVVILDGGKVADSGDARAVAARIPPSSPVADAMPAAVRLHRTLGSTLPCPLSVREGRRFITDNYGNSVRALPATDIAEKNEKKPCALEFSDVFFRYSREGADVLRGMSLRVPEGSITCLVGGNGAGKSTALAVAAGLCSHYAGKVRVFGEKKCPAGCVALLPQDVESLFLRDSVREELADAHCDPAALPFELDLPPGRHPYDLSGGQRQLLALAKVISHKPHLLLLDEPTKGLDAAAKRLLTDAIRRLAAGGMTVLAVTHDTEFAADIADRCALLFRGEVVSEDEPHRFFSDSAFYTTPAARMTRGYFDRAVTVGDVARLCRMNDAATDRNGGGNA